MRASSQRRWSLVILITAAVSGCTDLPTGPADTRSMRTRGVTLADWTPTGYASASAAQAIADIVATGANALVIVHTVYQANVRSTDIAPDPDRTPTTGALLAAISNAHANGMGVVLKPHVDPDDGQWRGRISPADIDAWFASYRDVIVGLAAFAENNDVDAFVIGTELASTTGHEARWRALIADVRAVFAGELLYAASWDEAHRISFWDALDCVGVDFYAPVARRSDAGRLELLLGWQPWIEHLRRLHQQTGHPVRLTEVGYRSIDGAGLHPYQFGDGQSPDPGEQADLYWAALEAVGSHSWIDGVYWWNWLANGAGGLNDTDYTPNGKPAEGELASAWK